MLLGTKWVAMARHGLILWENEATGSRKVSQYLPGPKDPIKKIKIDKNVENPVKSENLNFPVFFSIFYIPLFGATAGIMGRD